MRILVPEGYELRFKTSILFILAISLVSFSHADAIGDPVVDSIVLRGIRQVHHEQCLEAVDTFKKLIEIRPGTPMPYFYIAATYLAIMHDYINPDYNTSFKAYIDSAVSMGEKRVENGLADAEDYFYYGASLGYRGIYQSDMGNWWEAFKDGARARGKLVKALEMDSTNYDVYYGLGAYDYWRSAKTKALWWLPFFGDKRKQGIEYHLIAINKGKYTTNECRYALIRIYHEEADFDSMFNAWYKIEDLNPDDPFALWWLADGYVQLGQWENAENMYKRLLNVMMESPYYHPNGEVSVRYRIAYAQYNQNKIDDAYQNLKLALALEDRVVDHADIKDYLQKSRDLLKRIEQRKR